MKNLPIYEIPQNKKYWLIKTDGGDIYDHFISFGVMAIGHLDILDFNIASDQAFYPNKEQLRHSLTLAHRKDDRKKGYTTNHLAQINTFIYEVNVGDWVIAKGSNCISIGRVQGSPVINKAPYTLYKKKNNIDVLTEMKHSLRRKVEWGPKIKTKNLPHALKYSLGARQSLYSIDKHEIAIHHMLYPYFKKSSDLYLSFKILKSEDIDNFSVTKILNFLNELEVLSKTFEVEESYELADFERHFNSFISNHSFQLTTKAGFYSEGDIWAKLGFNKKFKNHQRMFYAIVIYAMIFGNDHLGMQGIIDVESRQKLWAVVAKRMEVNFINESVNNLKLENPDYDTKTIENNEGDEDPSVKVSALKPPS